MQTNLEKRGSGADPKQTTVGHGVLDDLLAFKRMKATCVDRFTERGSFQSRSPRVAGSLDVCRNPRFHGVAVDETILWIAGSSPHADIHREAVLLVL
jgi:hypothetical protein